MRIEELCTKVWLMNVTPMPNAFVFLNTRPQILAHFKDRFVEGEEVKSLSPQGLTVPCRVVNVIEPHATNGETHKGGGADII